MASDVNITSSAVNVVARLDQSKSYYEITKQLKAISNTINSTKAFQVKLNMSAADMESINKMVLLGEQKKLTALQAQKAENERLLGIKKQETEEAKKQKILAEAQRAAAKAAAQEAKTQSANTLAISNFKTRTDSWLLSHKDAKNYGYLVSELDRVNERLRTGAINAAQANNEFNKLKLETKRVAIEANNFGRNLVTATKRMFGIYDSIGAIILALRSLRTAVRYVTELDSTMVDLQIASGKSADEVGRMMEGYHELAKEIGATSVEVAKASDGWLRQGYSAAEANELIRNSTMLAKLGQMEAAEATSALTSAMKGYKLGVEEAEHIVDKFAATDMNAAVSAGYLATAMAQTAVGASKMGIDFDTLTGYIATVGEVTQQSAESVGNFFKTLVARMGNIKAGNLYDPESAESLSDVETVLKGAGIALRDSQDEFRNFKDVLDDVAKEWHNYSSVQQRAIAVAFSGTRQQERFMVLMENYDKAMELAGVSANSAGTAVEKYGAYLDSIGAKSAAFKSAVYDLADSFINSGLTKNILDIGTGVVNVTSGVVDLVGALPTLLGLIGAIKGIGIASTIFKFSKALVSGEKTIGALLTMYPILRTELVKTAADGVLAAGGMTAFSASLKILKAHLLGVLKTFVPYIAAVAAVGAGLHVVIRNYKTAAEEFEEISAKISNTENNITSLAEELERSKEITEELITIENSRGLTEAQREQLAAEEKRAEFLKAQLDYEEALLEIERKRAQEKADSILNTGAGLDTDLILTDKTGLAADSQTHSADTILQAYIDEYEKLQGKKADLEAYFASLKEQHLRDEVKKDIDAVDAEILALGDKAKEVVSFFKIYAEEASFDIGAPILGLITELQNAMVDSVSMQSDKFNNLVSSVSAEQLKTLQEAAKKNQLTWDALRAVLGDDGVNTLMEVFGSNLNAVSEALSEISQNTDVATTSFANFREIVHENADSLKELETAIETALDWRSTTEQTKAALAEIKNITGIELDIDAEGVNDTLMLMKSYIDGDAEAFEELAETAVKSLGIKPSASGIESVIKALIKNFNSLTGVAATTGAAILGMFESLGAVKKIAKDVVVDFEGVRPVWGKEYSYELDEDWLKNFNTKRDYSGSSSGGSKTDAYLEDYKKLVAELDHLRAMDLISEEEYYRRLEALADQYLAGKSEYIDEYRSVQEKLWAYQKELYEQQRAAEIEAAENRAEQRRRALEREYEAEKEALEKRKDLLEDEKDAYKDLIDYKKDLLDDASDERSHDQRVEELNQDIAQIEAELAAIALDDSAKANARRVELHDELMEKQKELEDEQWDWSVENQKDALDEEYDRYEKTIDAQIKLLEEQLDALEKSYDAQLDRIEDMLAANISAINSSFDALINRAAEAAAQIEAIFASINISTSQGIADLQAGLVGGGYDIGDWGSNNDGVDGVMGKDTIKGLQSYLNDLQSSGAISFGSPLNVDGIIGSKTRRAIDAAIAAGYLDPSFDSLHTGGIVGQKSGRNDLDIIKELIPLDDNEVWAKLLKKEMVLTEGQQESIRNAFRSIADTKASVPFDVSKSRTLAGSVTNNNSPAFTIHNVFEGNVDNDTMRRLDEWGNKFKKDVQNGVFQSMNQQNKFAGRTPVKTI